MRDSRDEGFEGLPGEQQNEDVEDYSYCDCYPQTLPNYRIFFPDELFN
ncbi:MAG: hypothetical protein QMD08_07635 [Actinomycetota bacterium]|nr:hypothetical protein [Actinomycetota bacterium]